MSHFALGVEGAIISTENPGHLIPGFRVGGGQQGYAGIICTCPKLRGNHFCKVTWGKRFRNKEYSRGIIYGLFL